MSDANPVPALKLPRVLDLLLTPAGYGGRGPTLPAGPLGVSAGAVTLGRWTP